jgi:hypothetical protein
MTPEQMQDRILALEIRVSQLEFRLDEKLPRRPDQPTAAGDPGPGGTEAP